MYKVPLESYVNPLGVLNWPTALPWLTKRGDERAIGRRELLNPMIARVRHGNGLSIRRHRHVVRLVELVVAGSGRAIRRADAAADAKVGVGGKRYVRRIEFPDLMAAGYRHINIARPVHVQARRIRAEIQPNGWCCRWWQIHKRPRRSRTAHKDGFRPT